MSRWKFTLEGTDRGEGVSPDVIHACVRFVKELREINQHIEIAQVSLIPKVMDITLMYPGTVIPKKPSTFSFEDAKGSHEGFHDEIRKIEAKLDPDLDPSNDLTVHLHGSGEVRPHPDRPTFLDGPKYETTTVTRENPHISPEYREELAKHLERESKGPPNPEIGAARLSEIEGQWKQGMRVDLPEEIRRLKGE